MGFEAFGQADQERQAAGFMREAVSWILSASAAHAVPRLHSLPCPGSCLEDDSPRELRPQQQPHESQDEPVLPQEQHLWVGVDIGGTLCKVVRWEIGGAQVGASEDTGGLRTASGTARRTGSKTHPTEEAPARLHVHSHDPIPTLCSLCHLGGHCLEEAAWGTSAASKTSSSTSCSSSSTCSASLWSSGLAPLDRSCSSGPVGEACTCPLTPGTLRFTRFGEPLLQGKQGRSPTPAAPRALLHFPALESWHMIASALPFPLHSRASH